MVQRSLVPSLAPLTLPRSPSTRLFDLSRSRKSSASKASLLFSINLSRARVCHPGITALVEPPTGFKKTLRSCQLRPPRRLWHPSRTQISLLRPATLRRTPATRVATSFSLRSESHTRTRVKKQSDSDKCSARSGGLLRRRANPPSPLCERQRTEQRQRDSFNRARPLDRWSHPSARHTKNLTSN
jgi:hypothetical protein